MKKKIILGTAQFFSNYGIANKKKTNKKIVKSILNYAYKKNIRYLDTAISYKNCDKNLGKIGVRKWKIITKVNFPIDGDKMDIKKKVLRSMRELKINKFYGILVHNSCAVSKISFLNNYKELIKLKKMGITQKIGISIYGSKKLNFFLKKVKPDIVQTSLNIFDQRLVNFLNKKKIKKVEFYARSIFLQGLLIQKSIPIRFKKFSNYFKKLKDLCKENKIKPIELLIYFVLKQKKIKNLIFGVNSKTQLKEIINIIKNKKIKRIHFKKIPHVKAGFIDPRLW